MTQITQAENIDNCIALSPILERNSQIAIQDEDGNEEVADLAELGYNADQNIASIRIENSNDVHVGNAVNFNAPVTIYNNVQGQIIPELQNEEEETNVTIDGPIEEPNKFSSTGFKQIKKVGIRAIILLPVVISLLIGIFILFHNFWPSQRNVKWLYKMALKRNTSWPEMTQPANLLVFKFDEFSLTTLEEQWESRICNFWIDTNGNVYEFAGWNFFAPLFEYEIAVFVCLETRNITKNMERFAKKLMKNGVEDEKLTKDYKIATMTNVHDPHAKSYEVEFIKKNWLRDDFFDDCLTPHQILEEEGIWNCYYLISNVPPTTNFDKTKLLNISFLNFQISSFRDYKLKKNKI